MRLVSKKDDWFRAACQFCSTEYEVDRGDLVMNKDKFIWLCGHCKQRNYVDVGAIKWSLFAFASAFGNVTGVSVNNNNTNTFHPDMDYSRSDAEDRIPFRPSDRATPRLDFDPPGQR